MRILPFFLRVEDPSANRICCFRGLTIWCVFLECSPDAFNVFPSSFNPELQRLYVFALFIRNKKILKITVSEKKFHFKNFNFAVPPTATLNKRKNMFKVKIKKITFWFLKG